MTLMQHRFEGQKKAGKVEEENWVVVSNIFYFPLFGEDSHFD